MRVLYQCEICKSTYDIEEKAKECEARGYNPTFRMNQKVRYEDSANGDILTIADVQICGYTHRFIYRAQMKAEDNPGKILISMGWINEEELFPL